MADGRFMLIQIPTDERILDDKINPVLNKALDWVKVSENTWIVWTTSSAEKWFARINKDLGEARRIFIVAIDPKQRHGRMPRSFWEFLNKER